MLSFSHHCSSRWGKNMNQILDRCLRRFFFTFNVCRPSHVHRRTIDFQRVIIMAHFQFKFLYEGSQRYWTFALNLSLNRLTTLMQPFQTAICVHEQQFNTLLLCISGTVGLQSFKLHTFSLYRSLVSRKCLRSVGCIIRF